MTPSSKNAAPWIFALALALAGGALGYFVFRVETPAAPAVAGDTKAAATVEPPPLAPPELPKPAALAARPEQRDRGLGLLVGDAFDYAFSVRTAVHFDESSKDGTDEVRGVLSLYVYQQSKDGWLLGLRVGELESVASGGARKAPAIGETLALLGASGQFEKVVFAEGATLEARNTARRLLGWLEVGIPKGELPASWDLEESDAHGRCKAHYERVPSDGGASLAIRRTIAGRRRFEPPPGVPVTGDELADGTTLYVFDPALREIDGSETVFYGYRGKGVRIQTRFGFVRTAAGRRSDPLGDALTRLQAGATGDWAAVETPPPQPRDPARAREMAGTRLDELRASLAGDDFGTNAQTRSANALAVLLQDAPETAAIVAERLADGRCGDAEHAVLTACLGTSGTKEAQDVLLRILEQRSTQPAHGQDALLALGQSPTPTPEVDPALLRVFEEAGPLATNALLVLGSVGQRVRESAPERHGAIRARLEQALKDAKTPADVRTALRALSNLGLPSVSEQIDAASTNEEEEVRSAAAIALLRVADRQADVLLRQMVEDDPSAYVRLAALRILVRRQDEGYSTPQSLPLPLRDIVRARTDSDASESVRDWARKWLEARGGS